MESLSLGLDESMQDALVGAYEDWVMQSPLGRLNSDSIKKVGDMLPWMDLKGVMDEFYRDIGNPDFDGDVFENLKSNLRNALSNVTSILDEAKPGSGEGFLQSIFDSLINDPGIIDAAGQAGIDIGRTLSEAATSEIQNASTATARAFNEAFSKNEQISSLSPSHLTASGVMPADILERKQFNDFAQNFNLTPLAEDLSNIDDVLAEVNQGLETLGQQSESMSQLPQFELMREHLEGAAQALQDIQDANSAIQEQGLYDIDREQPDLSETGISTEGYTEVEMAAIAAAEADRSVIAPLPVAA